MKIIIASTMVPFDCHERKKVNNLIYEYLKQSGNQVEKLEIPFSNHLEALMPQLLALRLYHIEKECDKLICTDVFANLIKHDHKSAFIINAKQFLKKQRDQSLIQEIPSLEEYKIRSCLLGLRESEKIFVDSYIFRMLLNQNGINHVEMLSKSISYDMDSEPLWGQVARRLIL